MAETKKAKTMSRAEKALMLLAALTFVGSVTVHSTYRHFLFSDKVSSEDAIAKVVQSSNQTRRRAPDSFEFRDLDRDDLVANGDYVYSGEKSQILIRFIGGTRILIGEQSLVVLREVEGNPELMIEKGAISGTFEEEGAIEVATQKEAVIVNGEKDSQFYVSYLRNGGLEIGSVERQIRLEYNGKSVTIRSKQKARVAEGKPVEIRGGDDTSAPAPAPVDPAAAAANQTAKMPQGLEITDGESKERITLKAPYPQVGQIFLHRKGGKIPVFPKAKCQGECELTLTLKSTDESKVQVGENARITKKFSRDSVPVTFLTVQPGSEARVTWQFQDGPDQVSGEFEVLNNNEASFQKAFQTKRPIEVMN